MSTKARRGRRFLDILGVVLLLAGAVLLFAPLVEGALAQREMDEQITKVAQVSARVSDKDDAETVDDSFQELRTWLQNYNQQVVSGSLGISSDPFLFDDAIDEFGSQGLEDGLIGYIQIPAMDTSLPLYLGSTKEHLRRGATVVEGSSAPLGGATSNCLIAAHRGYGSPSMMFRDIEKLSLGDKVYVTTPWETLVYTVTTTKVISPSDTEAVGIQEGRDLVTLITCHPYGSTASRYVVECERDSGEGEGSSGANAGTGAQAASASTAAGNQSEGRAVSLSAPEIEDGVRLAGGVILAACAVLLAVRAIRERRKTRARGKHSK